jgi:hypothetical protein
VLPRLWRWTEERRDRGTGFAFAQEQVKHARLEKQAATRKANRALEAAVEQIANFEVIRFGYHD